MKFLTLPLLVGLLVFCGCKPKEAGDAAQATEVLSSVLAEETLRLADANKSVVIVTFDSSGKTMSVAEKKFRDALKEKGGTILSTVAPKLGDPMSYDEFGWNGADFVETIQKFPFAGAIVSFVGSPAIKANQLGNIPPTHPPIVVVAVASLGGVPGIQNRSQLPTLINVRAVQLAIVDADPSAAGATGKTAERKTFSKFYQIISQAE